MSCRYKSATRRLDERGRVLVRQEGATLGDKERAEMLLELEKTVSQVKELTYKLSEIGQAYEKAGYFLKNDPSKANLDALPSLEEARQALMRWQELSGRRDQLEKALGKKIIET
jgi:hypothetical protein